MAGNHISQSTHYLFPLTLLPLVFSFNVWYNEHMSYDIGEIKSGLEIGMKTTHKFIWHACEQCGKQRWVKLVHNKPRSVICALCSRHNNKGFRGGALVTKEGYRRVYLDPNDFFFSMGVKNPHQLGRYVFEHRLVVAKALGRCLHLWEIVHHKGTKYPKGSIENKQDNRYPENLQLVTDERHRQITILETRISHLENLLSSHGIDYF